jgi:XTP/dITP diphosphohydrolase
MTSILLATRNPHKVAEIRQILAADFRFLAQTDFPSSPTAVEDTGTFAGNARKKAEGLAAWLAAHPQESAFSRLTEGGEAAAPLYVVADDSGLEVDALGGAPGVHSARFAAGAEDAANSPDAANNAKLLRLLAGIPPEKRTARFRCVLALAGGEGPTRLFEGSCEGRIALSMCGAGGFGYDPLFVPEGCDRPFAELGDEVKNKISHRARALAALRGCLAGLA